MIFHLSFFKVLSHCREKEIVVQRDLSETTHGEILSDSLSWWTPVNSSKQETMGRLIFWSGHCLTGHSNNRILITQQKTGCLYQLRSLDQYINGYLSTDQCFYLETRSSVLVKALNKQKHWRFTKWARSYK